MKQLSYLICLFLLLAVGCTSPPRHELINARQALANAGSVGADEVATTEYLAARAALRRAEELASQGNYQAARDLLPFAAEQARQASIQAVAVKQELARQQALQAEADRQQQKKQSLKRQKPQPKAKSSAAVKKPVIKLSSYNVSTEESLWQIAAKDEVYAEGTLWPLLYKANRDQIKNPRKVYPGQTLEIPRGATQQELDAARLEATQSGLFSTSDSPINTLNQL